MSPGVAKEFPRGGVTVSLLGNYMGYIEGCFTAKPFEGSI